MLQVHRCLRTQGNYKGMVARVVQSCLLLVRTHVRSEGLWRKLRIHLPHHYILTPTPQRFARILIERIQQLNLSIIPSRFAWPLMANDSPLRGACSCGRNQYLILTSFSPEETSPVLLEDKADQGKLALKIVLSMLNSHSRH